MEVCFGYWTGGARRGEKIVDLFENLKMIGLQLGSRGIFKFSNKSILKLLFLQIILK
jgi:hypothetical protein